MGIGVTYFRETAEGEIIKEDSLNEGFTRGFIGINVRTFAWQERLRLSAGLTLGTMQFSEDMTSVYDTIYKKAQDKCFQSDCPNIVRHGFSLEGDRNNYYLEFPVDLGIVLFRDKSGVDSYTLLEVGSGLDFILSPKKDLVFVHRDNDNMIDGNSKITKVKLKNIGRKVYPPVRIGFALDMEWAELKVGYTYQYGNMTFNSENDLVRLRYYPSNFFDLQMGVQYRF
jgi:hypothetical protein